MFTACLIGIHIATSHFHAAPPGAERLRESNPGAYLKCPGGTTAGTLRNSYGRQSVYLGHTFERGALSLTVGAITGYPAAPVLPMVSAGIRVPVSESVAWRLSFLPKAPKVGTSAAVHLSLELSGLLR